MFSHQNKVHKIKVYHRYHYRQWIYCHSRVMGTMVWLLNLIKLSYLFIRIILNLLCSLSAQLKQQLKIIYQLIVVSNNMSYTSQSLTLTIPHSHYSIIINQINNNNKQSSPSILIKHISVIKRLFIVSARIILKHRSSAFLYNELIFLIIKLKVYSQHLSNYFIHLHGLLSLFSLLPS